ncbi:ead/Ea22-like family protein [Klebsiella pneumoniae]|uniref:ead/Ea22-like family protein n=1 Tax=Klebsiella pneumoniae TaxID=573 RepID=UPI00255710E6|nr:ead/Ea22-like family protein [Klebsiella pneumoniae]MEC5739841.1 ead/Ea22-like family protein [Klebsiella pneumoniae]
MTDITELAQRMKAAAEKATPGEWVYFPKNTSIEYDVGSDESQGSILYVDSGDFTQAQTDRNGEFIALANPANILALVEALEKAQQRISQLESRTVTPVTYSENADADYCRKWAWEQVKDEVSTEDWTTGDSITYFGFFCWGWDMRRQYNEQRPVTVTAAADDVLAERKRQVTTEGWTPEHDDQHVNFEMAIAGGLYAISAVDSHHKLRNSAPSAWPWDRKWWKPDGPRRDLVKAGALILAEIERLDRAAGIKVEAE